MKNKIAFAIVAIVLFMASCKEKQAADQKDAVDTTKTKVDTVTVKKDSL